MACLWCKHFRKDPVDGGVFPAWNEYTGKCTRFPTWENVEGDHYCSELRMEPASLVGEWRYKVSEYLDLFEAEKARRIRAEKAAKELRRKLRDGGAS